MTHSSSSQGDEPIAILKKNSREEIHVGLDNYNGHDLFNMRVWFEAEDGSYRPGKSGLAFKVAMLPDFKVAVDMAIEEAQRRGLLP